MNYIRENEANPFTKPFLSLEDDDSTSGLNALIARATSRSFITPYVALESIQKILAHHFIFLPKLVIDDGDQGNLIFHLDQFGSVVGQTNDGNFNLTPESGLYFYFEYSLNENGFYDIFSEIVDEDDLNEILQDYDGEDDEEDMSDVPVSTSDLEHSYNTNQEEHSGMTFSEEIVTTGTRPPGGGPLFRGRTPVKNAVINYGNNGQVDSYIERENRTTGDVTSSREVVQKNPNTTYTSSTRATTNPAEPDVYKNVMSRQTSTVNIPEEYSKDEEELSEETFSAAFAAARQNNQASFPYKGKTYSTRKSGESEESWKSSLKGNTNTNTNTPVPAPRRSDRMPLKTTVASPPERPVGSLPTSRQQTTVASPPERPVGNLPVKRQQTTVATPPQRPVGSLPSSPTPMDRAKELVAGQINARNELVGKLNSLPKIATPPERPVGSLPAKRLDLTSPINSQLAFPASVKDKEAAYDELTTKLKSIGNIDSDPAYVDRSIARSISREAEWRYKTVPEAQPQERRVNTELTTKLNRLNENPRQDYITSLVQEAMYKGREVTLNKPFRTPGERKKSAVYVDPDGDGKAKIVRFGDPNMSIKKDQPSRKKSYCRRSSGQGNLTDKGSANYWSRKAWDC